MPEREKDPILKIGPVDPFNPQPTIVELKFDTPKEVDGQYGKQFLYGLKVGGKDHVLFASEALDRAIADTGAKANDHVAIVRTGEGKDTRWTARLVDANGRPAASRPSRQPAQPEQGYPASIPTPSPAPARPTKSFDDRLADFLSEETLYLHAMKRALDSLPDGAPLPSVDINAVAFVLYRMAKDHGIQLDADGQPIIEAEPVPPEVEQAKAKLVELLIKFDDMPDDAVPVKDLLLVARVLFGQETEWHNIGMDKMRDLYRYTAAARDYAEFLQPPPDEGELPF